MSNDPPEFLGAPSELAEADEMPGCVTNGYLLVVGVPFWLIRELPTIPLDILAWADEKGGWRGVIIALLLMLMSLIAGLWILIDWIF